MGGRLMTGVRRGSMLAIFPLPVLGTPRAVMSWVAGAIHHRFGVGDGFVLVVDEWESAGQFQQFFSNPDLQAFIAAMGAEPGPPEITVTEAVDSVDQF